MLLCAAGLLVIASPSVHGVSVTISDRALILTAEKPHGQVQLISGAEPLEYEITQVEPSEFSKKLLWSPKKLIVPPRSSIPVRFSYRGNARNLEKTETVQFRISVKPTGNTSPLAYQSSSETPEKPKPGTTSARVDLLPSLIFKVHVQPEQG